MPGELLKLASKGEKDVCISSSELKLSPSNQA